MSAPAPTVRGTPSIPEFPQGFPTKVTIGADPTVGFWEKSVAPPGFDGGAPLDLTTMFNTQLRTKAARVLSDSTDVTGEAAYSLAVYPALIGLINVETTITITFPDGSTIAFFGYLQKFIPQKNETDTKQPVADFTIIPTNRDPVSGAQQNYAYHAGTTSTTTTGT